MSEASRFEGKIIYFAAQKRRQTVRSIKEIELGNGCGSVGIQI